MSGLLPSFAGKSGTRPPDPPMKKITCPHCGAEFRYPLKLKPRVFVCPYCRKELR